MTDNVNSLTITSHWWHRTLYNLIKNLDKKVKVQEPFPHLNCIGYNVLAQIILWTNWLSLDFVVNKHWTPLLSRTSSWRLVLNLGWVEPKATVNSLFFNSRRAPSLSRTSFLVLNFSWTESGAKVNFYFFNFAPVRNWPMMVAEITHDGPRFQLSWKAVYQTLKYHDPHKTLEPMKNFEISPESNVLKLINYVWYYLFISGCNWLTTCNIIYLSQVEM